MKKPALLVAGVVATALLSSCGSESTEGTGGVIAFDTADWQSRAFTCQEHNLSWDDVNDWYYQLQFMDYFDLANTRYDMIVIDPEPQQPLNSNIIDRIRCSGDGEKMAVAYLSIGKAENFRSYWQSDWTVGNPQWIAAPVENFPGEFHVRYWDPQWRSLILGDAESRLDRVIEAGFDGVVLDGVDGYAGFLEENPAAISDMHALIADIRDYAVTKSGNSDFGIFVQNTEELIENSSVDWTGQLTGIVKISAFYAPTDNEVDTELRNFYDGYLNQWVGADKKVFTIDFAQQENNIDLTYNESALRGYIPLTVPSFGLHRLSVAPGYEPD